MYIDTFLDPRFEYDYTDLKDDSMCVSGNDPYKRPFGWKRIAIKVEMPGWAQMDGGVTQWMASGLSLIMKQGEQC